MLFNYIPLFFGISSSFLWKIYLKEWGYIEHAWGYFELKNYLYFWCSRQLPVIIVRQISYAQHLERLNSVLFCGNAQNELLSPLVIYKASHLHDTWCRGGPSDTQYAVTKSGWMETIVFENWMKKVFIQYKISAQQDNYVILFMDGHGAH